VSARRIARELAVIVFPQLPKDGSKLESLELSQLVARAVQMLVEYAKQSLADADGLLQKSQETLTNIEVEHENNAQAITDLAPVAVTTADLRRQLELIERAVHLASEALDIPDIALQSGHVTSRVKCRKCDHMSEHHIETGDPSEVRAFLRRLITTYNDNRDTIDRFIKSARGKWKLDRMVSIDRDILRLACAEAFYMTDVPIRVAINEAVELSHRFADERAARYINGLLSDLAEAAETFRKTGALPPECEGATGQAAEPAASS